jgi:4-aminobutyrate aminotransferase-like enzyme
VFERGSGSYLWDVGGKRYLDFEAGQFCMNTGHSDPRVTAALTEQASTLMQIGNRFTNVVRIRLARRLVDIAPRPLDRALFCSVGSEANETALRVAKKYTGRFEVVGLARGYHGRTSSAFSLSSSARGMRRGYGPGPAGVTMVLPPYEFRCPFACGSCDTRCWQLDADLIDRTTSGEPAALIMEFVIGAGGIIPVPAAFAREVRQFCTERDILLIADEALTGMGRTGRWFAFEHAGIVPDMVVTSKGLGGGVPLAAILTSSAIADGAIERGFVQAASHQGDPFQCAAGMATIDIIDGDDLLTNARIMGERLHGGLRRLTERYSIAADARGIGLIRGLEIAADGAERPDLAAAVSTRCLELGLIVGGLRPGIREGNVLRLAPPLSVSADEIDEALAILDAALAEVAATADA